MLLGFTDFMLLTGNSNPEFAGKIAKHLGLQVGKVQVSRFSDGEINVEIRENIRGRDVFRVVSTFLAKFRLQNLQKGSDKK